MSGIDGACADERHELKELVEVMFENVSHDIQIHVVRSRVATVRGAVLVENGLEIEGLVPRADFEASACRSIAIDKQASGAEDTHAEVDWRPVENDEIHWLAQVAFECFLDVQRPSVDCRVGHCPIEDTDIDVAVAAIGPSHAAGAVKMSTSIRMEANFETSPQRVYEALLDAKQFSAFSGGAAEIQHEEEARSVVSSPDGT